MTIFQSGRMGLEHALSYLNANPSLQVRLSEHAIKKYFQGMMKAALGAATQNPNLFHEGTAQAANAYELDNENCENDLTNDLRSNADYQKEVNQLALRIRRDIDQSELPFKAKSHARIFVEAPGRMGDHNPQLVLLRLMTKALKTHFKRTVLYFIHHLQIWYPHQQILT